MSFSGPFRIPKVPPPPKQQAPAQPKPGSSSVEQPADSSSEIPKENSLIVFTRPEIVYHLGFINVSQLLNNGGFSELYHVTNIDKNGPVGAQYVLKWKQYGLDERNPNRAKNLEEFEKVCENEKKLVRMLKHENIVDLFQVIKFGPQLTNYVSNTYLFLYEYLPCDLQYCIDVPEPIIQSERGLGNLFEQIGSAIEYCHEKGVIHHDIKPANILIENCTTQMANQHHYFVSNASMFFYKLSGFSAADNIDHRNGTTQRLAGTPAYMSYNKFKALQAYNGYGADVYAFMITLLSTINQNLALRNNHFLGYESAFQSFVKFRMINFLKEDSVLFSILRDMDQLDENKIPSMKSLLKRFEVSLFEYFI